MSSYSFTCQQTSTEFSAFTEPMSCGSECENLIERNGTPTNVSSLFSLYLILSRPLTQFLWRYALTEYPLSSSEREASTDQNSVPIHSSAWFLIPSDSFYEFLQHDAFTEHASFGRGNETPIRQNGRPAYSRSWLIPAQSLFEFLRLHTPEPPSAGGKHKAAVNRISVPTYAPFLLVPAKSLLQFLQRYEIPEPSPLDNGHETPAERQLERGEGSLLRSDMLTQTQDSDQVDAQPNENTPYISRGCPVCKNTFRRVQERNRHIESYLPHSILCPSQGCTWVGRHQWDFRRHWRRKHSKCGRVPGEDTNEIYDPKEYVESIVDGKPVDEVAWSAFTKVQESLERLGKADIRPNVLGRNRELQKWIRIPSSQLN